MENKEIERRVKNILANDQFPSTCEAVESINESTSLINDFALDSIQILELIVELEKEFSFTCEPYELSIDIFDRFGDLVGFIRKKINAKPYDIVVSN